MKERMGKLTLESHECVFGCELSCDSAQSCRDDDSLGKELGIFKLFISRSMHFDFCDDL